jgi:arabinose-5-phosphate isomerase
MHRGAEMPLVALGTTMAEAVSVMTEKRFGCVGILDANGRLAGIVTDGDLRRHLGPDLLTAPVEAVMTRNPKTIEPDMLVGAALDLLNQAKIMTLFILEDGRPLGIVHMHDFLKLGAA